MRRPPWPHSLCGQMIALVLIGLGSAQGLSFVMSRRQHQYAMEAIHYENALLRIASVVHLLAETPAALSEWMSHTLSSRVLQLSIAPEPVLDTSTVTRHCLRLRQRLATLLGTDSTDLRIGFGPVKRPDEHGHTGWYGLRDAHVQGRRGATPRGATDLIVAVQLGDGRWLNTVSSAPPPDSFWRWSTLLYLGLAAVILSGLMIFMVRRITWPLARLALAADRFGRG